MLVDHLARQRPDPRVGRLGEVASLRQVGRQVSVHLVDVVLYVRKSKVHQILAGVASVTTGMGVVLEQGGGDEEVLNDGAEVGEGDWDTEQEAEAGHKVNLSYGGNGVPAVSEAEDRAVNEHTGGELGLAVAAVVPAARHSVVPEHQEHRVPGKQPNSLFYHGVHLAQLPPHLRVVRPVLVTRVINTCNTLQVVSERLSVSVHTQKMSDENIPAVLSLQVRSEHFCNLSVNCVKIPDIK